MEARGADSAPYSCNLELLFSSLSSIKSFSYYPVSKINLFFVTHINGTICPPPKKKCSRKWFIVILHLRTLMPLIGLLWLTNCIFLFLFFFSPSGVCFSSIPRRRGVTLSLSLSGCSLVSLQCTFSLSPFLLPYTMSFWLNTLSELLFCLLLF